MISHDVRFALRLMQKSPGFTAVAVISLALGIGANTAIFSLINAIMLRQMPVERPDQLVEFIQKRLGYDRNDDYMEWSSYAVFVEVRRPASRLRANWNSMR